MCGGRWKCSVKLSVPPLRRNLIDPRSDECCAGSESARVDWFSDGENTFEPNSWPCNNGLRSLLHSMFLFLHESQGLIPSQRSFIEVHCRKDQSNHHTRSRIQRAFNLHIGMHDVFGLSGRSLGSFDLHAWRSPHNGPGDCRWKMNG